jgi:hypothetical protein
VFFFGWSEDHNPSHLSTLRATSSQRDVEISLCINAATSQPHKGHSQQRQLCHGGFAESPDGRAQKACSILPILETAPLGKQESLVPAVRLLYENAAHNGWILRGNKRIFYSHWLLRLDSWVSLS